MLSPRYTAVGSNPPGGDTACNAPLAVAESFKPALGFPDLILVSRDNVPFCVDSAILLCASRNCFDALPGRLVVADDPHASFSPFAAVRVPEDEGVLSLVLHAMYGLHAAEECPRDLAYLEAAAYSLLVRYAAHPGLVASPGCVLYDAIVGLAHHRPLDAYALAARFGVEPLAVALSARMLSYPLCDVTDQHARRIGPLYLCRLFNLQIARLAALRDILMPLPRKLVACSECPREHLNDFEQAWTVATAGLLCDANAGVQGTKLEDVFRPLLVRLCCTTRHRALATHIVDVVSRWAAISVSEPGCTSI